MLAVFSTICLVTGIALSCLAIFRISKLFRPSWTGPPPAPKIISIIVAASTLPYALLTTYFEFTREGTIDNGLWMYLGGCVISSAIYVSDPQEIRGWGLSVSTSLAHFLLAITLWPYFLTRHAYYE